MDVHAVHALLMRADDPLLSLGPAAAKGHGAVGIFAKGLLPAGACVGSYTGELRSGGAQSTYSFDLGNGWALDPVIVKESMGLGRTEVFMHACLVHFINEPAMGERCNIKFYTDERNCRIYAQALADIQPGAELLASYGSFRRKCNYAVDVAECTAQRPLQLGCRTDLGTGTAQNQQSKAQADLWRRNSFQGSEIDFSQPNRRAEVMVEARFLEMFGGPHCTAGTSNEMSAGDSMSARAARADPEPRRRLRRCDQQGGDGSAKLDLALSDVLTSSASSAPPTGAGSVDMLVNGEVILQDGILPPVDQLRTWTQASQQAYWKQRWAVWAGKDAAELHWACTSKGLWPGGQQFDVCKRLLLLEFQPTSLVGDDFLGGTPPLPE